MTSSIHPPKTVPGPMFILRPALMGLMVYAFLLWVAQVWVIATWMPEDVQDLATRSLLGPITLPMVLGFVHFGWLLLCVRELRLARLSPPGLRRGHAAGAGVGVLLCLALLYATWQLASAAGQAG